MSPRLMWIMKSVMQPWRVTDRKKKKLPERGIALSKWVIEYCDKGNQNVQLKSKLPLPWWNWTLLLESTHMHMKRCIRTNMKVKLKWLWATELGKWIMKGEIPRPLNWIRVLKLSVHLLKVHWLTWPNGSSSTPQAKGRGNSSRQ